ncbi:hypothetical protein BBJ28_00022056 [Nothophytophthora sp. Chile5]|nr:hypothetical protein BBJ28_00022056 [Nothophytophthora sp. Chile5]
MYESNTLLYHPNTGTPNGDFDSIDAAENGESQRYPVLRSVSGPRTRNWGVRGALALLVVGAVVFAVVAVSLTGSSSEETENAKTKDSVNQIAGSPVGQGTTSLATDNAGGSKDEATPGSSGSTKDSTDESSKTEATLSSFGSSQGGFSSGSESDSQETASDDQDAASTTGSAMDNSIDGSLESSLDHWLDESQSGSQSNSDASDELIDGWSAEADGSESSGSIDASYDGSMEGSWTESGSGDSSLAI